MASAWISKAGATKITAWRSASGTLRAVFFATLSSMLMGNLWNLSFRASRKVNNEAGIAGWILILGLRMTSPPGLKPRRSRVQLIWPTGIRWLGWSRVGHWAPKRAYLTSSIFRELISQSSWAAQSFDLHV